ncbi:MAG: PAS domain S-box protein [Ardenticatenales bacterium]|nr:PAS domain S-box protein [Ardenticatenales bacterium]
MITSTSREALPASPAPPTPPPAAPTPAPASAAPSAVATAAQRRALVVVRRLRWALPLAILAFVAAHQIWEERALAGAGASVRMASALVVYGLAGPLVTFWTLDWIARALARQAETEARVRLGERHLASITSGSADAILSLDLGGIVRSWNRGAAEMLGFTADEIVGQPVVRIVPERLQPGGGLGRVRDRLEQAGFVRGVQARCRHKDGHTVPVDMTQTRLWDDAGRPAGTSLVLRDMTTRIAAERAILELNRVLEARVKDRTEQLAAATGELAAKNIALQEANADLSRLDQLKDDFVALVSHELRAPLTNINASVELMEAGAIDDRVRAKLAIVGHEASRLTRLVKGVLDVSRIQAGRFTLHVAPTGADDLVAAALRRLPAADRVRVRVAIAPDVPPLLADPDRAAEALGNVIENAAKYSAPGSAIEVDVRGIDVAGGGASIAFAVTDRGAGIPPGEQARIFDRFHRVERDDARETYGHGLGLHIARAVAEAHGGGIDVTSRPGEGSTFVLRLPAAAGNADRDIAWGDDGRDDGRAYACDERRHGAGDAAVGGAGG